MKRENEKEKKIFIFLKKENMFWIDNLIWDFLGSLNWSKTSKWYWWRSTTISRRKMYNIWYKAPPITPIISFIPSDKKNDSMRQWREAMKYGWIDKFRF